MGSTVFWKNKIILRHRVWITMAIAFVLMTVTCMTAFAMNNSDYNQEECKMKLSDRQIEILEEMGLPSDEGSLTEAQKKAISEIETLLLYMEEKYGTHFNYISYKMDDWLDDECLYCYPDGYTPTDKIAVSRIFKDGEYVYTDDYNLLLAGKQCTEKIRNIVAELIPDKSALVVSKVSTIDKDYNDATILEKACTMTRIFVSSEEFDEENLKEFATDYCEYMAEKHKGKYCEVRFFIMDQDVFEMLDEYTWEITLDSEGYKYLLTSRIYEDGTFTER